MHDDGILFIYLFAIYLLAIYLFAIYLFAIYPTGLFSLHFAPLFNLSHFLHPFTHTIHAFFHSGSSKSFSRPWSTKLTKQMIFSAGPATRSKGLAVDSNMYRGTCSSSSSSVLSLSFFLFFFSFYFLFISFSFIACFLSFFSFFLSFFLSFFFFRKMVRE